MKKVLCVLLVGLMLFTSVPLIVFAESSYETNKEVSYNASNALGSILSNAINNSSEETENNNGYGVFGIEFNLETVDVSLSAPDYATVVVAVYEEETKKMVTSGKSDVNSDTDVVTVSLGDYDLPDYFIIKVFILDYNNAPVCEAYENKEYTKVFEEFFAKNIFDFDEEKVISLNNDIETNFAVVSENAKVIKSVAGKNIVVTDNYEKGLYVLENADDSIKSLKRGDTFYYVYGDGAEDYILTKVGKVKTEGKFTTVAADSNCQISDLFSYIDINTSKQPSTSTFAFDDDSGDEDINKLYKFISGKKKFEDENGYLSFSVEGDVIFHLSFYYDFELFETDKYEFEYWVSVLAYADVEANLNTSFEKTFELVEKSISVFTGLDLVVKLDVTITFEASITAKGEIVFTMKNGASATQKGYSKIQEKPTLLLNVDIEGDFAFHFIPELTVGVKVLKVFHADMNVPVDFSTEGTLFVATTPEELIMHSCATCIDGTIDINVQLKITVNFGVDDDVDMKIVDIKPVDVEFHLGNYYISIDNEGKLKFGFGKCPNKIIADGICGDNIVWNFYGDGTLELKGTGDMWNYHNGESHRRTPWYDFRGDIKKVEIEKKITNIGDSAFGDLVNLKSVNIPDTVTHIGGSAFNGCTSLEKIKLHNDITYIGSSAFKECNRLRDFDIPDKIKTIDKECFYNCDSFVSIEIPDGVESIGVNAFCGCASLKEIKIPDSVTEIGNSAFRSCESLISVDLPDNLTDIAQCMFTDCASLKNVSIPNSVKSIAYQAFYQCISLKSIILPSGLTIICDYAFAGSGLETITIPDSVTDIQAYAFCECNSLLDITLSNNLKNISGYLFYGCDSLADIIIPEGVESIDERAFCGAANFTYVSLPSTLKTVSKEAFYANNLTYVDYAGTRDDWEKIDIHKTQLHLNDLVSCNGDNNNAISLMLCNDDYAVAKALMVQNSYNETLTSATIGDSYVIIIVRDKDAEDLLSRENLLYIDQKTAETEIIEFDFVIDESITEYDVVYFDAFIHTHSYVGVVTKATCTEDGYTTYICSCGDSYVTDEVSSYGHDYTFSVTKEPTHLEKGVKTFTCECGAS